MEEEYLNSELRGILEQFVRIRDAYVAMETYCEVQEEALSIEKERYEKMKENLEKLSKTYLFLERRYKTTVEKLQNEGNDLRKIIEELKKDCDDLRLINAERIANDEQMRGLQDEVECLKVQLLMQEEKHNEDIALLKQQHTDEIQRYKMLLQNAKLTSTSNEPKKRGRPKNSGKNKKDTYFRWPELNIEKINDTTHTGFEKEIVNKNIGTKKRKLFHEDKDTIVDIVQSIHNLSVQNIQENEINTK
ncbi:dynein regulatory complex protein 9-like [Apis mellifera caucasica]|uniref:Dynein regulatory complex protein 9-like n=1 Tax=Apis mellifera TaxID=7460 RepID=A0A7M7MLM2_APIME|nr:dynein regulatory complex protein 9-like [Apis mellifera]KAG6802693.1 dynein regulatory complex protein 9-like [Apis mellifera caucasica]|eukprot:XP_026297847.1 dynein regulatory complex protein 9-like [Apis mellifera]